MRRGALALLLASTVAISGCVAGKPSKPAAPRAPEPSRRPVAIVLAQSAAEQGGSGAIWRVSLEATSADYPFGMVRWALAADGRRLLVADVASSRRGPTRGLGLFDVVLGGDSRSVMASAVAAFGWDTYGRIVAVTGTEARVHGGYTQFGSYYRDLTLWRGSPGSLASRSLLATSAFPAPFEFVAADDREVFLLAARQFLIRADIATGRLSDVGRFPQPFGPPPSGGEVFERPLLQRPGSPEEGSALLRYGLPVEVDEYVRKPAGKGTTVLATPKALKIVRLQDLQVLRSVAATPAPAFGETRTFAFDDTRSRALESVTATGGARGIAEIDILSGRATELLPPSNEVLAPLGYVGAGGDFAYLALPAPDKEPEVRLFIRRTGMNTDLAALRYATPERPVVFLGVEYAR